MVKKTTSQDFAKDVTSAKGVVFVDFFAEWCGPCKVTDPIIHTLSDDPTYKDISFVKVDVDEAAELSGQYNVFSIPTFMIFKDGKPVHEFVGARDKAGFEEELKKGLKS
ncbi:MAG: thioredoxin [Candidatus Roizmanbacteria bacterium]